MKNSIATQYNDFCRTYSENRIEDEISNASFFNQINFDLNGKTILDIGCGDGADLQFFSLQGAATYGIDPSAKFVAMAKERNPTSIFLEASGEQIPFGDAMFDIVVSKYALQTSRNIQQILREAARVLKKGGTLLFLSKHPLRQWIEKVRQFGHKTNYYEQKVISSHIFSGKIALKEPSHTISDYFNKEFYSNFEVLDYQEGTDFPASEQIDEDVYPTFFVVKAKRK